MPLILSGNVASALPTGYDVANSCRFDEAVMHITPGSEGDTQKMTLSMWVKRSELGVEQQMWHTQNGSNQATTLVFGSNDKLYFIADDSNKLITTRVFRDPSAWYHIVLAIDTTLASATNRARLYINGTEETAFGTDSAPSEDQALQWTKTTSHRIGSQADTANNAFNGYLAEVVWIDGTQYAASDFGEFDEDSPNIWKPKKVSTLTFGTNGFYLDFEASDNLGNDANGGTDLTEVSIAATDQTTDSPTNNVCTINPLYISGTGGQLTLSDGNTTYIPASSGHCYSRSSIGFSAGKWYFEAKVTEVSSGESAGVGACDTELANDADPQAAAVQGGFQVQFSSSNTNLNENAGGGGQTLITNSFASGDIVQMAVDADDGKIWLGHNGTWYNDDNASTTFSASNHDMTYTTGSMMQFYFQAYLSGSNYDTTNMNFGNPAFAISSSNSDANGYGNFEFPVPSGFYALCTKNLAEFG